MNQRVTNKNPAPYSLVNISKPSCLSSPDGKIPPDLIYFLFKKGGLGGSAKDLIIIANKPLILQSFT
jgi:hypothetical protein